MISGQIGINLRIFLKVADTFIVHFSNFYLLLYFKGKL